jgi:hypothetical protein
MAPSAKESARIKRIGISENVLFFFFSNQRENKPSEFEGSAVAFSSRIAAWRCDRSRMAGVTRRGVEADAVPGMRETVRNAINTGKRQIKNNTSRG